MELIPVESHLQIEACLNRSRDGVGGQYECPLIARNGNEIWTLLSTNPILDNHGSYAGTLVMLTNITVRKQMEESLRRLSTQDSLTGLFNRRHFFTLAEQEFERSQRYGRPLALLMLDIDHFKKINDQHGHLVGDEVLQVAARIMHDTLRRVDVLARYGGEEFVMLLPETTLLTAMTIANRLCTALATEPIVTGQGTVSMTASIGVAVLTDNINQTLTELLGRADQALYHAKQAGRNQVQSHRSVV